MKQVWDMLDRPVPNVIGSREALVGFLLGVGAGAIVQGMMTLFLYVIFTS